MSSLVSTDYLFDTSVLVKSSAGFFTISKIIAMLSGACGMNC